MKLLLLILTLQVSAVSIPNPFWVALDKKLIKNLSKIDKSSPKEFEKYFLRARREKITLKQNLGFGWKMWNAGVGGGYIHISANFYYFKDSIISYSITPNLPDEKMLIKKYTDWYSSFFQSKGNELLPYKFQEEEIMKPLIELPYSLIPKNIPPNLLKYMSPKSGTLYGYSGGYGNDILPNRKLFQKLNPILNKDHIIFAMFAINPASRFTAIETYIKNKKEFVYSEKIEYWIEQNFEEIPKIKTLMGCSMESWSSRFLVRMMLSYE
jgi:hypothetical protein